MLNNTDNNTKICLIEDIFKMGTLLAVYLEEFQIWLNPTGFMFDCLYDKSLQDLDLVAFNMQIELNSVIHKQVVINEAKNRAKGI